MGKIKKKRGRGILNKIINELPFEAHIPGYQYCGPGTKLAKRLARGDAGINLLDVACKEHDIAYSRNRVDVRARNKADKILADKARERVSAKDSSFGEKAAAWGVSKAMDIKAKLGMGLKKKKINKTKDMKAKLAMCLKRNKKIKDARKKKKKKINKVKQEYV